MKKTGRRDCKTFQTRAKESRLRGEFRKNVVRPGNIYSQDDKMLLGPWMMAGKKGRG